MGGGGVGCTLIFHKEEKRNYGEKLNCWENARKDIEQTKSQEKIPRERRKGFSFKKHGIQGEKWRVIFLGCFARGKKTSPGVWEVFGFSQSARELESKASEGALLASRCPGHLKSISERHYPGGCTL